MDRTPDDLERAAAAAGAKLLSTKRERLRDGTWTLAGTFGFDDPWAAARLLCILAEEDAGPFLDPEVLAWSCSIRDQAAHGCGLPPDDPRVLDPFLEAVHANVQRFIRFEPEVGERFQSPRTTMIEGVGDCDCQARLVHALVRAQGAESELRFFESNGEPSHAVAAPKASTGHTWAETTIDAAFGEHPQEAYRRLGLDKGNARPDIGGQSLGATATHDDVVALQTRLQDLMLATSLAIEACPKLPSDELAAWSTLATQILGFVSGDPGVVDYDVGQQLASELANAATELRAAGCQAPIPAPIPKPAAPPSSSNPFEGFFAAMTPALKWTAFAAAVVVGGVVAVKVIDRVPKQRSLPA